MQNHENNQIALQFWENIPVTLGKAYKELLKIKEEYVENVELEKLCTEIRNNLKSLGVLTDETEKNIDRLRNGVVESGQQPMPLGGTGLILNKIAYSRSLCSLGSEGFSPLFFVADYDGVHHELLNIRTPNPSETGLLTSYPAPPEYINSPIKMLPNPSEKWMKESLEKIVGGYKGLMKGVDHEIQENVLKNLRHVITVIKNAFYSTNNVSDWATKILASVVNIEADIGIPFLVFSEPNIRRCFQEGFEFVTSEPYRSRFIQASNETVQKIEEEGYRPQIGYRSRDYVPFFFECMTAVCNRNRIEMKYYKKESEAEIRGKCSMCGEEYSFSVNQLKPDFSDIIDWISPRVDSRQIIVDSVLPVLAHIGGPGETSYYAEVIPAVRQLKTPFPIFLRYTRTFYNTPWNEKGAKNLGALGLPTITENRLFQSLSLWVEGRNSQDEESLHTAHQGIYDSIMSTYDDLLAEKVRLENIVEEIKITLRNPEGRNEKIKEMQRIQRQLLTIKNYLSSAYGRFAPERFGQEVSWAWLDMASINGIEDLMGVFMRQYNLHTPNSSMFYVNL